MPAPSMLWAVTRVRLLGVHRVAKRLHSCDRLLPRAYLLNFLDICVICRSFTGNEISTMPSDFFSGIDQTKTVGWLRPSRIRSM